MIIRKSLVTLTTVISVNGDDESLDRCHLLSIIVNCQLF